MSEPIREVVEVITRGTNRIPQLVRQNEELAQSVDNTNRSMDKGKKALEGLAKAAAAYLTIDMAKKVLDQVVAMGELGAEVGFVKRNFEQFAVSFGKNSSDMQKQMRAATKGMVSDLELQQFAMQSMVSDVKFDDMVVAMDYVSRYAAATGQDVSQKMQSVMTGFARGSAEFMDDVGINVMGAKDVISATIDQMKDKMHLFADASDDPIGKIKSFRVQIENLKNEISQRFTPVLTAMIDLVKDIKASFTTEQIEQFKESVKYILIATLKGFEIFGHRVNNIFSGIDIALNASIQGVWTALSLMYKVIDEQTNNIASKIDKGPLSKVKAFRMMSRDMKEFAGKSDIASEKFKAMSEDAKESTKQSIESWKKRSEAIKNFASALETAMNTEIKISPIVDGGGKITGGKEDDKAKKEKDYTDIIMSEAMKRANERLELWQMEYDYRMDLEEKAREQIKSNSIESINNIAAIGQTIRRKGYNEELKNIDSLKVSEQEKEKMKMKLEEEYQRKQRISAGIAITTSMIIAKMDAIGAAVATLRDTKAGPLAKLSAAGMIFGTATGYISQMASLSSQKFYNGGNVPYNGNHRDTQVAMVRSGEKILNPTEARRYDAGITNNSNSNVNHYNINVSVQGGGSNEELTAMLTAEIPRAIENASRTKAIDWNRIGVATV